MKNMNNATVEQLEACFGLACLKCGLEALDGSFKGAAAAVRGIVDRILRPLVNEDGVKGLDAWLFYHDKEYVPQSWMGEDGRVPLELLTDPEKCIKGYEWETESGSRAWDGTGFGREGYLVGLEKATLFLSHFWNRDDKETVEIFLKNTWESDPEFYGEVLEVLVKNVEKVVQHHTFSRWPGKNSSYHSLRK